MATRGSGGHEAPTVRMIGSGVLGMRLKGWGFLGAGSGIVCGKGWGGVGPCVQDRAQGAGVGNGGAGAHSTNCEGP